MMERALPAPVVLAKRLWRVARVAYYMFRKSFAKRKLTVEIHLLFKRSKLKGKKAIWNLISHHQQQRHVNDSKVTVDPNPDAEAEAEFVKKVFRSLHGGELDEVEESIVGMPVRQLRITDSPFSLSQDEDGEEGENVDVDAEEFITKFYQQLRQQQSMDETEN